MKTISEVIGTADLFAEIAKIHEFAAFRNVESRDLTAWFLAYHGDRLVQPGMSDMTVPQLAMMIVHFKQDVIETLTEHAVKVFQAVLQDGSSITTHTHDGTSGQTQKQQVVPNNLTEMRDRSQITTDGNDSYSETTTVNKDLNTDYKQVLFTNDLLCDIFAVIANAISLYVYM